MLKTSAILTWRLKPSVMLKDALNMAARYIVEVTMTFKVNDRVFYISGRHGKHRSNPLKGSMYECVGTVTKSEGRVDVRWDNGSQNSYIKNDLCHAGDDAMGPNPNMAFRIKKLGKRR